jgi:hypothetical protein
MDISARAFSLADRRADAGLHGHLELMLDPTWMEREASGVITRPGYKSSSTLPVGGAQIFLYASHRLKAHRQR